MKYPSVTIMALCEKTTKGPRICFMDESPSEDKINTRRIMTFTGGDRHYWDDVNQGQIPTFHISSKDSDIKFS